MFAFADQTKDSFDHPARQKRTPINVPNSPILSVALRTGPLVLNQEQDGHIPSFHLLIFAMKDTVLDGSCRKPSRFRESTPAELAPGAKARSPVKMPPAAWLLVFRRVWEMWGFHNLGLLGAGVAFFTFLAITPLIAATVMIYGLVADPGSVSGQMKHIVELVPPEAAALIQSQLLRVVSVNSGVTGVTLAIALVFAVYGGMRAASGMIGALNVINEEHETRGIIAVTWRAILLTLAAILLALTGLLSAGIFAWLEANATLLSGNVAGFAKFMSWLCSITLGMAGFALVMRYGPDRRPAKWRWLMPGAIVATLLWLGVSFGFSLYVAYVSNFSATYGSLSAIVVFLMWLFLSAYGVLIGALFNAEIERQTTVDSTVGPEYARGKRGAVLADLAEGDLTIEQWREKAQWRAVRLKMRRSGRKRISKQDQASQ